MADLGKRYSRNLMGINAQGFVAGVDAVTAAGSTLSQLVHSTVPAGQISIIADGLTNVDALVAGEVFSIAQKIGGYNGIEAELSKSIDITFGAETVVTKVVYDAPVLQVDGASIVSADIDALLAINGLKEFVSAARDTTPANQPFPVEEGRAVVRNATTTAYDMFLDLVKNINGDWDYERNSDDLFAVASIGNVGIAGAVTVATSATLAQGSNIATFNTAPSGPVIGQFIAFQIPGSNAVADTFKVVAIAGASVTLDRVWMHPTATILVASIFVSAAASGDWGLSFTAVNTDTHFSSINSEDLADFPMATTQAWKQGSGDYPSVAAMEEEFSVFRGATTINAQWERDYGKPTRFADATKTYDIFFIKYKKTTPSMAFANEQAHHLGYEIIAAEAGGTAAGILSTIFGV